LWARAYLSLGALDTLAEALLFSVDSMSTRGASGLTLHQHWQMMGALEAVAGMLMFGISTAYMFSVMQSRASSGWLHAIDADTGVWKWRMQSNYPIISGVTPTAGGLVFFGDMGGNFYAIDASTGQKLWGQKIGGAIGGGVITYAANGAQKVAVATGYVSPAYPAEIRRAKIAILGLE
jgi:hypothetical protein